jgi:hypothetical protein
MSKISIDLETHAGTLPKEEVLIPTQKQKAIALAGALFTTKLMGKAEQYLEVIKIEFDQQALDSTHTKEKSVLIIRMTAILSNWQNKNEKIEAQTDVGTSLVPMRPKEIARELLSRINLAVAVHIAKTRNQAQSWGAALESLTENFDNYFSK